MLSHVAIKNFQSLRNIDIDILPLTVIVGPSSSGKSAFTRSLRCLTSNQRGDKFISHGEKLTTITAVVDRGTVTLRRGRGTNDNEYVTIPAGNPEGQRSYTKLGGETPPEVSEFIGIQSKDPINYAGQFDRPYLLDDSSGEVARVLGALTNVNIIFEAARESNRRKLAHAATLKTRAADLEAIMEKAETYRPLKGQLAAVAKAETGLKTATELERRISTLDNTIEQLRAQEKLIEDYDAVLAKVVPDQKDIFAAGVKLQRYEKLWDELVAESNVAKRSAEAIAEADEQMEALNAEYLALLVEAGECPTCHQNTKELAHAHNE